MSRFKRLSGGDNGDAGAEGQPPLRAFPKPFNEPFDEPFETLPSGSSRAFQRGFCTGFQGR
jgi:hypothetical protein